MTSEVQFLKAGEKIGLFTALFYFGSKCFFKLSCSEISLKLIVCSVVLTVTKPTKQQKTHSIMVFILVVKINQALNTQLYKRVVHKSFEGDCTVL